MKFIVFIAIYYNHTNYISFFTMTPNIPNNKTTTTTTNTNRTRTKFKIKRSAITTQTNHHLQPKKKTKFKTKPIYNANKQFYFFVNLCNTHNLPYFQFFDDNNWKGPVIKVQPHNFDHIYSIFDKAQSYLKTIILNGYGFSIIKPIAHNDDSTIQYPKEHYILSGFTEQQYLSYNSDMERDTPTDEDEDDDEDDDTTEEIYDEFIAEEWTYNGFTYLLNTQNNYLYYPSTLEFAGKKISDFSIDFNAKEQ